MLDAKTQEKLRTIFYPAAEEVIFGPARKALDKYVQPGARVLDAGCGKGTWLLRKYRGIMGIWMGIDTQPPNETMMNEFVSGDLENIPLKDATFDVILCHYVIEHLKQPRKVFAEFYRLLADGGILVFCTPCLYSPLFLFSRCTPNKWHGAIKRRTFGTHDDPFFTYYHCNTVRKLDKTLQAVGFHRETIETTEHMYKYFRFNTVAYAFGLIISRLIQLFPLAKQTRSQVLGVYSKP